MPYIWLEIIEKSLDALSDSPRIVCMFLHLCALLCVNIFMSMYVLLMLHEKSNYLLTCHTVLPFGTNSGGERW